MVAVMAKLSKTDFNKGNRFRNSRSHISAARCQLCRHNDGGFCRHPERSRRIILSEPSPWSWRIDRKDLSANRVCDKVEISVPDNIVIPDLEPGQGIRSGDLEHGDPCCPYIIARIIDEGRSEYFDRSVRVTNLANRETGDPCELPECAKKLGLRPWRHVEYLTSQGFEDGYIPRPPRTLDDGEPNVTLSRHELTMAIAAFDSSDVNIRWTEEAVADAVRLIKRLIYPHYTYDPVAKTYTGQPKVDWYYLRPILYHLGWGEVADRISFEMAVRIEERVYCVRCGLAPLDEKKETRFDNPVRIGARPHCPVCGYELTEWGIFIQAMPQ